MSSEIPIQEGTIGFKIGEEIHQTWYKLIGDLSGPVRPLVALHGGPGCAHYYILSLADLATIYGIPVIFYDQMGCGKSTHLDDKPAEFWTPELFMDELDNLLKHFGIEGNFDLYGHSWGGMLGSQYAATRQPEGLKHLIISNAPASNELWEKSASILIDALPKEDGDALREGDATGATNTEKYGKALRVFHKNHMCRLPAWPADFMASGRELGTVFQHMNGPSDFVVTGTLKTWSVIEKLPNIKVPTLLMNGRYDETSDVCVEPFFNLIPKIKWVQFAESSHVPQWEERERYMQVISKFVKL